jgi:hypothetical protein
LTFTQKYRIICGTSSAGIITGSLVFKDTVKRSFTYRLAILGLICLFCTFNIGLPVVIASCPMMKAGGRGSCCAPKPSKAHTQSIAKTRSTDCCKTVIAGERNTTEFVQSQFQLHYTPALEAILAPAFFNLNANLPVSGWAAIQQHPPPSEDIPITVSSLLI